MRTLSTVGLSVVLGLSGLAHAKEAKKAAEPKAEAKKEGAPAGGPAAAHPAPPKPAAELEQLKPFIGTFKCEMKALMEPKHDFKANLQSKLDVEKFWISWRLVEKKSKTHPGGVSGAYLGYDTAAKQFLMVAVHSGDGWMRIAGKGFDGDNLVMTGEITMGGRKLVMRKTLTKGEKKGFTMKVEAGVGKDKWMPVQEGACK
ncbi:MAG: hypothetical protein IT371_21245 [Deltaproteobacteria bacterium]|nr:hypothetical protein [Deltaproteobacteria bacterium]